MAASAAIRALPRRRRVAHTVCRGFLGVLFALAALFKLTNTADFVSLLQNLPMLQGLPAFALHGLALVVGAGESFLAVMLLAGSRPRFTSVATLVTLAVFTLVVATQFGTLTGSCACFWSLADVVPTTLDLLLARNAVFLAMASWLVWCARAEGRT